MARLPNFLVIIRSEKLSGKGQGRGCLGVRKKERFVLGKRTFRSQKSKHFVLRIIPDHIFLVRGKNSYEKCGAQAVLESVFVKLACGVTEFFDFEANPKIEDMEKGLSLLKEYPTNMIIAIGGGSVLDMAKLLRFFYSYSGNPTGGEFEKKRQLIPLITLPTTAGTGSEATHFSVLYKDKVKYSVEHDAILPDVAIVYPKFTYGNSKYLTSCTGFDALAQAIEAYWNVNATEESDKYAAKAIKLLWPNLPLVVNSPTAEARNKVSEGSYWAGRAINITKTTAPHAFSYSFTTDYGYPHGHAVALTFPFFMRYNIGNSDILLNPNINPYLYKIKMQKMLQWLNMECVDVAIAMKEYIRNLGLDIDISQIDISKIVSSVNIQRLINNPYKVEAICLEE